MNKYVVLISRLLLGLVFVVFGINGLMMQVTGAGFMPMPPPSEQMMTVFTGFMATKYLMALVKVLEIVAGALLLANVYLPAALTMLGPIMVNILGIHLFVDLSGAPMAIILSLMYLALLKHRWANFRSLLSR